MGKVECSIENGIATVVFSNPPNGFLTADMVEQLGAIFTGLEDNDEARVIIFTGGLEDVFIRHFSVEEIIDMSEDLRERRATGLPDVRFSRSPLRRIWEQIDNCQKPTVAAINGHCGGGGCELALCCDIRLAGPGDYMIGQMEIQIGILPGAGGTVRLARAVGTGKALEWVLRGRMFTPREAAHEGLIHHYIEDDVLAAAKDVAAEFLDKPPAALAAIKQVMRSSHGRSLAEGIDEEGDLFARVIVDERAMEMMRAYIANDYPLNKI